MDAKKDFHTLDDLYISPFTSVRYYDDNGQPRYRPLERNLYPTGIYAATSFCNRSPSAMVLCLPLPIASAAPAATSQDSSAASLASPVTSSALPTASAWSPTCCASPTCPCPTSPPAAASVASATSTSSPTSTSAARPRNCATASARSATRGGSASSFVSRVYKSVGNRL